MIRVVTALLLLGALLAGCRFEEGGLDWGSGTDAAGPPDDPGPADDPAAPDAQPTPTPPAPDAAPVCVDPLVDCGGSCVDLDSDRDHCGQCDRACGDSRDLCYQGDCRRFREEPDCDECPCSDCNDGEDCAAHPDDPDVIGCIEQGFGGGGGGGGGG